MFGLEIKRYRSDKGSDKGTFVFTEPFGFQPKQRSDYDYTEFFNKVEAEFKRKMEEDKYEKLIGHVTPRAKEYRTFNYKGTTYL